MDKYTLEKYFNNTCTVEEAGQVTKWFATEEGQKYLSDRLNEDATFLRSGKINPMLSTLNSNKMWDDIEGKIDSTKKNKMPVYNRHPVSAHWYVAATVLLVCGLSIFFYGKYVPEEQITKTRQIIHVVTQDRQQKELTLSDGTEIRLNSNSQLWISATYGQPKREVTLEGEAYFEVTHNPAKPFVIHTGGVVIKDLGTAFNVRAIPGKNNVQVAVESGKVSILHEEGRIAESEDSGKKAINLTQGQYAYLNLKTGSFEINEFEVENYLSWMNDQLRFNHAPLVMASEQLSHIYGVTFSYAADSLKTMTFSASFERESLKRTLAVIALTLSIDYQIKNHHVIWIQREKNSKILKQDK